MNKKNFLNWSLKSALHIGFIFLLLLISFLIFKPFLLLIVWGIILAVAFYPIHKRLTKLLKGKSNVSATIITLVLLILLITPAVFFINGLVDSISNLSDGLHSGSLSIPPPPENVKDWPVIGKPLGDFWQLSSDNLATAFSKFGEQMKEIGTWLLSTVGGLLGTIFIFIFALIISGIFLANSDGSYSFAVKMAERMFGKQGKHLVDNSKATIQSVVKGVIGVALIQATLVGIGFWAIGLSSGALLTLIVFILALVQIPPIIIVLPVIFYVFSVESTTVAVIFAIYEVIAGASDNFLKPLLLGRGLEIPMLVILIGAIGGLLLFGMIGLFVGSVILALAYQLFQSWLNYDEKDEQSDPT